MRWPLSSLPWSVVEEAHNHHWVIVSALGELVATCESDSDAHAIVDAMNAQLSAEVAQ